MKRKKSAAETWTELVRGINKPAEVVRVCFRCAGSPFTREAMFRADCLHTEEFRTRPTEEFNRLDWITILGGLVIGLAAFLVGLVVGGAR